MKNYNGRVSFSGSISFEVEANDKGGAKKAIFEDIMVLEFILKNGSRVSISEVNWDLVDNVREGNIVPLHMKDFEINEEI